MTLIKNLNDLADLDIDAGSVLTIGSFDGFHQGHKYLVTKVIEEADKSDLSSVIITFDQHPKEFLEHETQSDFFILTNSLEKTKLISDLNPDLIVVLPFEEIFNLRPEFFVETILIKYLKMKKIIIGDDFHFGKHRLGNIDLLKSLSGKYNYEVEALPRIKNSNDIISSSLVRQALKSNDVAKAAKLLGHNYLVKGLVSESNSKILQIAVKNKRKLIPQIGLYEVIINNSQNTITLDIIKLEISDNWWVITFKNSLVELKIATNIEIEFVKKL